jgi:hypothetical protein
MVVITACRSPRQPVNARSSSRESRIRVGFHLRTAFTGGLDHRRHIGVWTVHDSSPDVQACERELTTRSTDSILGFVTRTEVFVEPFDDPTSLVVACCATSLVPARGSNGLPSATIATSSASLKATTVDPFVPDIATMSHQSIETGRLDVAPPPAVSDYRVRISRATTSTTAGSMTPAAPRDNDAA